jgi:hypothetical protein
MLATDIEGKTLTLLAQEKVSHFDWLDNDSLIVWARFTAGGMAKIRANGLLSSPLIRPALTLVRSFTGRWKKRLLSEAYYKISISTPAERTRMGWPKLDSDGHPMVARSSPWIVTDTYPDKAGMLPVILYNRDTGIRIDAAVFKHGTRSQDLDVKCDLHPRWNRSEDRVAVDTCEAGVRQVRILNVRDVVGSAQGSR